ncbi:hypothetical protein [Pseudoalteromonas luteoviolacea]|uniref:Uncharacterized protein n=1 Tax=Pseudoalteromonas luteoviolacea (strain 2ta16) TaxID=1353533 RepID=V4HP32_PSEL2|nr:hypothetical protein [Pseudoalteromonas luteoviolacea]ESP91533.1 hypothetical protein PL2TA16_00332 [Pseudoalteromonas luteoviolacea 2ta16]KZN40181.1 hypothetical protein N483_18500 [Pseudoalteromonas luteoviolacea NCIMB 1944]
MELIEAILLGLQLKNLQKPFVFFSMLIGFLFFTLAGFGMLFGIYEILVSDKAGKLLPSLGIMAFSILFFALASVCSYMIKRCFR